MKKVLAFLLVIACAASFLLAAFVWPTRYRYEHTAYEGGQALVRIDRLTGNAFLLTPSGLIRHADGTVNPSVQREVRVPAPEWIKVREQTK